MSILQTNHPVSAGGTLATHRGRSLLMMVSAAAVASVSGAGIAAATDVSGLDSLNGTDSLTHGNSFDVGSLEQVVPEPSPSLGSTGSLEELTVLPDLRPVPNPESKIIRIPEATTTQAVAFADFTSSAKDLFTGAWQQPTPTASASLQVPGSAVLDEIIGFADALALLGALRSPTTTGGVRKFGAFGSLDPTLVDPWPSVHDLIDISPQALLAHSIDDLADLFGFNLASIGSSDTIAGWLLKIADLLPGLKTAFTTGNFTDLLPTGSFDLTDLFDTTGLYDLLEQFGSLQNQGSLSSLAGSLSLMAFTASVGSLASMVLTTGGFP